MYRIFLPTKLSLPNSSCLEILSSLLFPRLSPYIFICRCSMQRFIDLIRVFWFFFFFLLHYWYWDLLGTSAGYPIVALFHGNPVDLDLQVGPRHMLQNFIYKAYVCEVGYHIVLGLWVVAELVNPPVFSYLHHPEKLSRTVWTNSPSAADNRELSKLSSSHTLRNSLPHTHTTWASSSVLPRWGSEPALWIVALGEGFMYAISRNSQLENKNHLSAHCHFGQMIPTHSWSVRLSFNSQLETT